MAKKVPKHIPRGTFTEGYDFKQIQSACGQIYRKKIEKEMRGFITKQVNEMKNSITRIVITDDNISVYDHTEKCLFKM